MFGAVLGAVRSDRSDLNRGFTALPKGQMLWEQLAARGFNPAEAPRDATAEAASTS